MSPRLADSMFDRWAKCLYKGPISDMWPTFSFLILLAILTLSYYHRHIFINKISKFLMWVAFLKSAWSWSDYVVYDKADLYYPMDETRIIMHIINISQLGKLQWGHSPIILRLFCCQNPNLISIIVGVDTKMTLHTTPHKLKNIIQEEWP